MVRGRATLPAMGRTSLLVAVALSLSCAQLSRILSGAVGPPALAFAGESVASAALDRVTLTLSWRVTNPNPVSVELDAVEASLLVDGKPWPLRAPARGTAVPANGRLALDFPAEVRFQEPALPGRDRVRYLARGRLSFRTPLGPVSLPFEREGELPVPRPPEVSVALPRLKGLAPEGASLELPVRVKNRNPFPFAFTLEGALLVGSSRPASVSMPAQEQVGAGQTRTLFLPVQAGFPAAAEAAALFQAGRVEVSFEGALKSGDAALPVRFKGTQKLPRLWLQGVSVGELSLEGATLVVTLSCDNPAPIPLELGPSRLSLSIDGRTLAELQPPLGTQLAASSTSEVSLPLRFSFGSLLSAVGGAPRPKASRLRVDGTLAIPTLVGTFQLPVQESRPLELPRLLELAFGAPRLGQVTPTTATVDVPVTVTNRNGFAVPATRVSGSLSISGGRVGDISSGDLGALEAGGARTFIVSLTLDLLRTPAAAQAIRSRSASLGFEGSVASGGLHLPLRWTQKVAFTR